MGIKDLYGVLQLRCPDELMELHLSKLSGHRLAVDISIFLYKQIRSAGEGLWLNTFFMFLCTLKRHGIKTVCIFDGPNPPPEKKIEQARRRADLQKTIARMNRCIEVRDDLIENYVPDDVVVPLQLQKECSILVGVKRKPGRKVVWSEATDALEAMKEAIARLAKQTLPITKEHGETAKKIAEMMGVPVFQADGEAEALCAYMAVHGYVDGVLTEDTDVLAYGTPWMFSFKDFKFSDEKVHAIHLPSLLTALQYDQDEFRDLCILLECDYNNRVKGYPPDGKKHKKPVGIGLKGALCMIDEYRRLEEVIKHVEDPDPLIYERCREIFTPPNNAETKMLVQTIPYNRRPDTEKIRDFIKQHKLSISLEYIEKCWVTPKINFIGSDTSSSDDEDNEDFDDTADASELIMKSIRAKRAEKTEKKVSSDEENTEEKVSSDEETNKEEKSSEEENVKSNSEEESEEESKASGEEDIEYID